MKTPVDENTCWPVSRNVDAKLRAAIAVEGSGLLWGRAAGRELEWQRARPNVNYIGWDERLGAGFEYGDESDEVAKMYSMLAAKACAAFSAALSQLPASARSPVLAGMATAHRANAQRIFTRVRAAGPRWWGRPWIHCLWPGNRSQ